MPIQFTDLGSSVVTLGHGLFDLAASSLSMLYAGGMPDALGPAALTAGAIAGGAFGGADAMGGPDERIAGDRERQRLANEMRDPRNSPGARQAREDPRGGEVPGAPVRPGTGGRRAPTPTPTPDPGIVETIRNDPGIKNYGPRAPTKKEVNELLWGKRSDD